MKGIVIYYSQTGNTKKIAQAIHKGIAKRVEQCDLVSRAVVYLFVETYIKIIRSCFGWKMNYRIT